MFISKIAVRQNVFFSILAERYPNVAFSPGDNASLNKYFNLKGVRSLDNAATRTLIESLPEDWEAAKTLINNELSTQSSGSEKEAVAKALGVDVAELESAELISWLKSRYIDNTVNEVHPVQESMHVVKKFLGIRSAILQKLSEDGGFKSEFSLKSFNEESLKDSLKLSSDDMIWMINQYEHGGDTTIRTVGVEIREGEYLGKVGKWNIWFPHTQETSAKIAGYDDVTKDPHTTWCTARTKGSNLYYHYVSGNTKEGYIHSFLFYIIKDNPKNNNDWISIGFTGKKTSSIKPVLNGQNAGLTVNRANEGLRREDFDKILGADTAEKIFQICQNHIEEDLNYKHPAVEELRAFAKDPDAVKKALYNKSVEERGNFFNLMSEHNPTEDVLVEFSRFATAEFIRQNFSKEWMKKPNTRLRGKIPLDLALKYAAEADSYKFLYNFSDKPWAQPYIDVAAKNVAEKDSFSFLYKLSDKPWAQPYIDTAVKNCAEKDSFNFLYNLSYKPFAQPYIDTAAKNAIEKDSYKFLYYFSDKPWAQPHLDIAAKNAIEKEPDKFLYKFSDKPWAQPYIDVAAKIAAEEEPFNFIKNFSYKPWANTPVDSIGGKTWLQYAKKRFKETKASSIDIKLKKLAKFLLINKFKLEESWIRKLIKN